MEASSSQRVEPGEPVVYFSALVCASLVAALHEALVRQLRAYLEPSGGALPVLALGAGLCAALSGALAARRTSTPARALLPWLLIATALGVLACGPAWFFAFPNGSARIGVAVGAPVLVGLLVGATGAAAWRVLARALPGVGAVEVSLKPFRLSALALALALAATAATIVGPWRSAAAVAMALATAAAWCAPLFAYLDGIPLQARASRRAGIAAFAAALGTLAAAELVMPIGDLAKYDGDIVYTQQSSRRRWAVTSTQGHFALYVDGMLVTSTLDAHRYYEALVHPALSAAPRRQRVLLLGMGHGLAEREILRYSDVRVLHSVVTDSTACDLGRSLPFLAPRARSAFEDGRLAITEREPIVWLAEAKEGQFDAVVVDLPDPSSYLEAKSYTRLFYQRLAARLAPGAVGVVQATSPFTTVRTHATIEATLRAAGFDTLAYRAPIPSLGLWGFVLFSREPLTPPRRVPAGLAFLTARGLSTAFTETPDVARPAGLPPNLLHDQRVVALLEDERNR
jgi:spermidine synthase